MKVFYTTDLHGHKQKYKLVLKILNENKFDVAILGADILPKGCGILTRELFIYEELAPFFHKIKTPIIIDFGNDDLQMHYEIFEDCVDDYDHVHISHMKEIIIGGYSIIGMHYVPDYPFGLKDWCRSEKEFPIDPFQQDNPVTTINGWVENIVNLEEFFKEFYTIEEYLSQLPKPSCDKVIYNLHSPPRLLGFDLCRGGKENVGSYAITEFIMRKKPLLTLHGHIHESYKYSKISINNLIPETISIQPGQLVKYFTYCTFDLEDIKRTYKRIEIKIKGKIQCVKIFKSGLINTDQMKN